MKPNQPAAAAAAAAATAPFSTLPFDSINRINFERSEDNCPQREEEHCYIN